MTAVGEEPPKEPLSLRLSNLYVSGEGEGERGRGERERERERELREGEKERGGGGGGRECGEGVRDS